jgi:hypothetical protein
LQIYIRSGVVIYMYRANSNVYKNEFLTLP